MLTREEFERFYITEHLSLNQISKITGIPYTSISRQRDRWGIPTIDPYTSLVGRKFGRLTVQEEIRSGRSGENTRYRCLCDCGKVRFVQRGNLLKGKTFSCGCYKSDINRRPDGQSVRTAVIYRTKQQARHRHLSWGLSDDQAIALFEGSCYYCGRPPYRTTTAPNLIGSYTWNGIDRLNPKLGYDPNNTVSCCWECNFAKGTFQDQDFIQHTLNIRGIPGIDPILTETPEISDTLLGRNHYHYERDANRRGIPFSLTRDQTVRLSLSPCHYCGGIGKPAIGMPRNGIDRLDPTKGYALGNCVPCCWPCNHSKGKRSVSDFLLWVNRVKKVWGRVNQQTSISTR